MLDTEKPYISVVVTTKNEEKNIERCLRSILVQSYPIGLIEIIVVDNGSTDQTKNIALRYTNRVLDVGPERSAQRNFGVLNSNGEFILYLDADMALTEHVVSECVNAVYQDQKLVGLYIPEKVVGRGFWGGVRRFERSFYDATVVDCVRFVSRRSYDSVGGFDEGLTGPEDWDFDKKIRSLGPVSIVGACLEHHEELFSLTSYISKKGYYAASFTDYQNKWGKNDPDVRKQLGFFYRFFGVFVEQGRWKRLLRHPVLTVGMYFLRALVGIRYLIVSSRL